MKDIMLAIEISNPSSGPRGMLPQEEGAERPVAAGPGVALGRTRGTCGTDLLGVELLGEAMRHDDDLMPAIDRLCRRCDVKPSDLASIAVSIGPGGYTSLRIAVATAKMLAEATGASTIAVPSASVAAWSITIDPPALVCLASKGDTAWCELLPPPASDPWWSEANERGLLALLSPAEFALMSKRENRKMWIAARTPLGLLRAAQVEALAPRLVIADRFLPEPIRAAAATVGATIVEPVFAAEFVLSIARGMEATDPVALAPCYPREPEAVTQWRKRAPGVTKPESHA